VNPPLSQNQTILDKYKITRSIGEGGMGRVWLAEEITFGNRQVAIKEARQDLPAADREEVRRRYEQEVRICADLAQAGAPHIVRAITAEPYGDSVLLVMEYLAGGDLAGLLTQRPQGVPVDQALTIAVAALQALHVAHTLPQEAIHRDVKPQNILLDSQGRAHLGDWGLAQRSGHTGSRSHLAGGSHPGDPRYMAPEQAASADYLTPAADLYALGCVLFELLTGKPYKRVRPGTLVSSLRADAPAWLDSVLIKALIPDPWDRYESAAEMEAALTSARPVAVASPAQAARRPDEESVRATGGSPQPTPAPAPPPKKRGFWRWLLEGDEETLPAQETPRTATPAPAAQTPPPSRTERGATQSPQPQRPATPAPVAQPQPQPRKESERTPSQPAQVHDLVPPFVFRNGKQAKSLAELVHICVENSADALWHLEGGQFAPWLEMVMKEKGLAKLSLDLRQEKLGGPARLKKFLDATGVRHSYQPELTVRFDWITIPAGPFWMGSDPARDSQAKEDEIPQHLVEVAEFRIARVPVTNAQFQVFVDATGYSSAGSSLQNKEHPVVNVSWLDAIAFCEWAGVRLPSEAEWEKAARGVDGRTYPWGYETPDAKRANFGSSATTPVGSYQAGASPYGVLDMAGNVWEWTSSLYQPYPYKAGDGREDLSKRGQQDARVLRGGGWNADSKGVRCAYRRGAIPVVRDGHIGFRVVVGGGVPPGS
jgi:formylglycine-generating enzyme required for sulfatase activity